MLMPDGYGVQLPQMILLLENIQPVHMEYVELIDRIYTQPLRVSQTHRRSMARLELKYSL